MLHVLLNFINSIYSLLSVFLPFAFHSLPCIFSEWLWMQKQDSRSNFYIFSHLSVAFSLRFSPSVSLSCFLPFFPDDSHPSMKSISHLGTGWHWHAGRAIWRLMAKLYYTSAPEWQSAVSSQLPYLSDVFMNSLTEACFNIWFHSLLGNFFQRISVCTQVIDLDQWYCVCLSPSISTAKPWPQIFVISLYFPPSPFFSFFISVSFFPKRADYAPVTRSWSYSLK